MACAIVIVMGYVHVELVWALVSSLDESTRHSALCPAPPIRPRCEGIVRAHVQHPCGVWQVGGRSSSHPVLAGPPCVVFDAVSQVPISPGPRQYKNRFSPHGTKSAVWCMRFRIQNRLKIITENIRAVHELSNFCKDPEFAVIVKIGLWPR